MPTLTAIERLRRICLALPEAHEVEAWGEPTFRVRNKIFAVYATAETHHGAGRASVWVKAKGGNQDLLVRADPARYFAPPYVGPKGWI
ncbi:MAG TPA: MmcQ/YjbR family DNA-binding protein, partial [Gemmatimonadaceae bacterium]|nr:MmcQ/YjbR family DNA-binding protein [Gemmatimonadaceae bacterium]